MTLDPEASNLVALFIGVFIGILIALPWRPLIRRRVATKNIDQLSRQLREAIAELDHLNAKQREEPFSGGEMRGVV